jgi:hypothetical protein
VTGADSIVGVDRVMRRLYPRRFRDDYGDDMESLLRDQLRDEPAWRVCDRALVDFAVTVPVRHLEAHMPATRTPALVFLASLVVASAAFAFVEGLLGVIVAALGAVLAMLIWRRERPARAQRDLAGRGWTLLACGAVLLAILIAATTAAGELSEPAWAAATLALLVAVTLLGTGVVLGFVRLADRRRCARGAT